MTTVDLIVAGGGPIGLATAILARRAGLEVVVVEPRSTPIDKACGEGLMPSAVRRLEALGVLPDGRPFHGIRYLAGPSRAEARFRRGPGLGVRRTTLHAALSARAGGLGVVRRPGRLTRWDVHGDTVAVDGLRARWLVGADGLHSTVRRTAGLERAARGGARYGLRRHFRVRPWTDLVEVHWAEGAEAYVTPVADDLVGVAILCGGGAGFDAWLARFPELRARLDGAAPVTPVSGAGPLRQRSAAVRRGPVLLVGDAAGYVDALTGEGIAVGLACAEALVSCLARGRPAEYDASWRAASRRYRWSAGTLLGVSRSPVARRVLVPAASRLPGVFASAVNACA